jgi:hypothetical protein
VKLEGVNYRINWRKFRRGTSFMIPCLNPKETREKLEAALKRLKLQVLIKVVIEEGVRGLRVWKL